MDNNQLRTVYRAINLICYFTFAILLNVSCKNKNIGLDNVEQVKQDSTGPIRQDTVLTVGRGGIYYNDDIVSTPPKEIVYKFTKYYTRVDTILYPTNFIYTIGVFGYYPFLKYRVSPTNNTPIYAIVDLGSMLPIKQKWEYVATFDFFSPVSEEFTLTPTLTLKELDSSVVRSTKIKIEVAERNVDVLHSTFGMSREQVKKAEKDELNVADSDFLELNPELILIDGAVDLQYWGSKLVAFTFKNNQLTSIMAISKTGTDLSELGDLASDYGNETTLTGLAPVKWQKNGLQLTAQMKEVLIRPGEKKTVPCLIVEKIP
ncbi:hypothetical protein LXM25_00860 [Dyadobacter sp. LJ53]|uniref:hypothetical protein n=1 Tax=Dyadobacter chenwenxiniae TaxID=2906456 RepID=UPI001F48EBD3|nr:hypothetical protein [Dyadobacter chenwenxiniae]MCF0048583.1 hypothetical protein [Dyadobacter chenwenxiniae]